MKKTTKHIIRFRWPGILILSTGILILAVLLSENLTSGLIPAWFLNSGYFFSSLLFVPVFMAMHRAAKARWHMALRPAYTPLNYLIPLTGILFLASIPFALPKLSFSFHSTLFPFYLLSGIFSSGIAILILISFFLRPLAIRPPAKPTLNNLAKYILTFSIIWVYFWYSQYTLIWYGNLPEEISFYTVRLTSYGILFYLPVILIFVVPFFLLVWVRFRQNKTLVILAAASTATGQWVDKCILLYPDTPHTPEWVMLILFFLLLACLVTLFVYPDRNQSGKEHG